MICKCQRTGQAGTLGAGKRVLRSEWSVPKESLRGREGLLKLSAVG